MRGGLVRQTGRAIDVFMFQGTPHDQQFVVQGTKSRLPFRVSLVTSDSIRQR